MKNKVSKTIIDFFNKKFGIVDLEDGTYELTELNDITKYSKYIWKILQKSYKKIGGFKSYDSITDMINRISLAIICIHKKKIVACAIYRDDLGGQKLNGCGTIDNDSFNKELLRNVIKDDIINLKKYHWAEISYPLEKWFKEENGNPIPSKLAYKLLHKSKNKIKELEDGVHYEREIGNTGIVVTKCIYGFNSEETYKNVMKKLEEYSGFENYDEFKDYINSLPKITENLDYSGNHPNKKIAIAMETIIQIGNAWDDGIHEMSPNMKRYLKIALDILQSYKNKNLQIKSLIKNGLFYYENMDTIQCHDEKINYLLYPIYDL